MIKPEKKATSLDVAQGIEGSVLGKGLKNAASRTAAMAGNAEKLNHPVYDTAFHGMKFAGKNVYSILRTNIATHFDFTGCDFTGADFTFFAKEGTGLDTNQRYGLVLQGCKFNNCKLDDAIFAYCDLRWANFDGATGLESVIIEDFDADGQAILGSQANTFEAMGI